MSPTPVYVLGVVGAVMRGDWALARWSHKAACCARVAALFDDGQPVDVARVSTPEGRLVGVERCSP